MADHDETRAPGMKTRIDEDDVEGHRLRSGEPEGIRQSRNEGGPDDISRSRLSRTREDGEEDDVEGHIGRLQSPRSKGE
jgi:hypothetical protein